MGHAAGEPGRPARGPAFAGRHGLRGHAELLHGPAGAGPYDGELPAPLGDRPRDELLLLREEGQVSGVVAAERLHGDDGVGQQFLDQRVTSGLVGASDAAREGRMRRSRPGGPGRLRHSRG